MCCKDYYRSVVLCALALPLSAEGSNDGRDDPAPTGDGGRSGATVPTRTGTRMGDL